MTRGVGLRVKMGGTSGFQGLACTAALLGFGVTMAPTASAADCYDDKADFDAAAAAAGIVMEPADDLEDLTPFTVDYDAGRWLGPDFLVRDAYSVTTDYATNVSYDIRAVVSPYFGVTFDSGIAVANSSDALPLNIIFAEPVDAFGFNAYPEGKIYDSNDPDYLKKVSGFIVSAIDGTELAREESVILDVSVNDRYFGCIGVGEGIEDLRPFDPTEFATALLGD